MPQNDNSLAGPRSWKTSIFSTFWKVFKTDENHHQLTPGHLKGKYLHIWMRNMQVCEMPKMTFFTQGRGGENLQFFQLSKKPFKMMKTTTSWPQDTWKVNICSFGWEIRKNVKCPKMTILSWKTSIFSTFWKVFKTDENHHQLTPGHLKGKYLPIWTGVLGSTGGGFYQFNRRSRKSKKLKFFMTADLRENCHFGAFHIFTYFSPKRANIYFSSVLWSTGGCFHHFKRLFGELKNLKIFPIPAMHEKCHFGHFTNLHISHPNGQIFTFRYPGVNWWWFSSVSKIFQKVEKIEVFHDRGPARELSFWGISHFHLFLTQMSKYLLFKCPVVNWWLFSSF